MCSCSSEQEPTQRREAARAQNQLLVHRQAQQPIEDARRRAEEARRQREVARRQRIETTEKAFMALDVGYDSEPIEFRDYALGRRGVPSSLNCWEAVVVGAIEAGVLDRAEVARLELDDGSDKVNTLLGIEDAASSIDSTTAPKGQVAFLFHTAHVVQCIGNGECLSWWGKGPERVRLVDMFRVFDSGSDDLKRDALSKLLGNEEAASVLKGILRRGFKNDTIRFPRYRKSYTRDYSNEEETTDDAFIDRRGFLSNLLYDLLEDGDEFEGITFQDVWQLFLPSVNNPRHGALKMGSPGYLR